MDAFDVLDYGRYTRAEELFIGQIVCLTIKPFIDKKSGKYIVAVEKSLVDECVGSCPATRLFYVDESCFSPLSKFKEEGGLFFKIRAIDKKEASGRFFIYIWVEPETL